MTDFINSYANIIMIILLSVAIVISITHLNISKPKLPKIKVYFPNQKTTIQYTNSQQASIHIHFKNTGKTTITGGDVCVYVPLLFLPKELKYLNKATKNITQTTNEHPYGDMLYLYTGKEFVLIHNEPGEVQLVATMPTKTGSYHLKVHFISDQGEGGTHDLEVTII